MSAPDSVELLAQQRFEANRKLLGWASKTDENGVPLLAKHRHGDTWWGSKETMPTYRCPHTEAQWKGWRDCTLALEVELAAWRERFPSYVYRPQDDCVALKN